MTTYPTICVRCQRHFQAEWSCAHHCEQCRKGVPMARDARVADLQRILRMSADELAADAPARSFAEGFCAAARGE